jgi:hypothetical protein
MEAHDKAGQPTRRVSDGDKVRLEIAVEAFLHRTLLNTIWGGPVVRFNEIQEAIYLEEGAAKALENVRGMIDGYLALILGNGNFSSSEVSNIKTFRNAIKTSRTSSGDRDLIIIPNALEVKENDSNGNMNGDVFIHGDPTGQGFTPRIPTDIPGIAGSIDFPSGEENGSATGDPTPNREDLEESTFGDTLTEKVLIGIVAAVIIRFLL